MLAAASAMACQTVAAANPGEPWIDWDAGTRVLVQKGGDYARIVRLRDGGVLCAFSLDSKLQVRHSADEGRTWDEPVVVAAIPDSFLANAEALILDDGSVLALFNERPIAALPRPGKQPESGALKRPFRILASRSRDQGRTWSPYVVLYRAGCTFSTGCWEPSGIQLPSGEIQVYFANEASYGPPKHEQEISLVRSRDRGRTWSKAERVIFRPGHRDGMPVSLLLQGGRNVVVAIEDNGLAGGRFKPVIVHATVTDDWRSGPVGGDSPNRWGARVPPLEPSVYGGAPYLRQLPSGQVLLSYQESARGDLDTSRMVVCIGDRHARGFGRPTYPLPGETQLWNSLFVKNDKTVTAVSTATIEGVRGIWTIDGHLGRGASRAASRRTNEGISR